MATEFTAVKKHWIAHIRQTFMNGKDIADALESKSEPKFDTWMPQLNSNYDEADPKKTSSNKGYLMLYEAEIKAFVERKSRYLFNLDSAYTLLFEKCSKVLKNKIQSRSDFASIKQNPILLIQAIEEHTVCYNEEKYPLCILFEALKNLVTLRQRENESLIDYTTRFKSAIDVLVSQLGGPIVMPVTELHISVES